MLEACCCASPAARAPRRGTVADRPPFVLIGLAVDTAVWPSPMGPATIIAGRRQRIRAVRTRWRIGMGSSVFAVDRAMGRDRESGNGRKMSNVVTLWPCRRRTLEL